MAFTQNKTFNINEPTVALENGDKLIFKLTLKGTSTNNITASITQGSLYVASLAASTGYASTDCPYFDSASISASAASTSSNNIITLDAGITNFHNNNYQFIPNPLTGSLNSLYDEYGDVDYPFSIGTYDIVLTYLSDGTYVESRIVSTSISNTLLQLHLDAPISNFYADNLISGSYQRFLILTRINDETNAHALFKKREGKTSYGFVIPENLAPDVLANIDTITREVKQKLLADQQGTTV